MTKLQNLQEKANLIRIMEFINPPIFKIDQNSVLLELVCLFLKNRG